MRKRSVKMTAMAMLASGCLFQFGCLGSYWNYLWSALPAYALLEFTADNTGFIDIFGDDGSTAWLGGAE